MIFLTHGYFLIEDLNEQKIMKPYVPLGILYISSYLEKHGIKNTVFDSTFSSFAGLQEELLNSRPGIVAVYTNLMTKLNVLKIISLVKNNLKDSKIILGGPEIRHYTEDYLKNGADMVVIGEGEETMLEISRFYSENKKLPENCDGTAYLLNYQLIMNKERALVKDIDMLPLPNRSKINFDLYLQTWKKHHGKSMVSVNTMRGCPYTCKWCSRAVYGGTYRRRSPALVVDELINIKRAYDPDGIWFVDDVFTINHKWLREFASAVIEKDAVIPYEIITRADRMNEEVIKLLKQSGCFRVWIGAESGSQEMIEKMDRRVNVDQVRDMILLSKKYGIETGTFIMLGYPGETKEDIRQTITHLQLSQPDYYTVTIAYPIKGTRLYSEVEEDILSKFSFTSSTDRDIDFKRTHPKSFYKNAVRWVYNEVNCQKEKNRFNRIILKFKSNLAQILMKLNI